MDGRPNVEIKLRFQISPAYCGREPISCDHSGTEHWALTVFTKKKII